LNLEREAIEREALIGEANSTLNAKQWTVNLKNHTI
jgi:hypothetical protein